MDVLDAMAPPCAFLTLALLASLVTALNLDGRPGMRLSPPNAGAAVFLLVLACFVALAGLGFEATTARGAALALGTAVAWMEPG
jgi:hypothetical protein